MNKGLLFILFRESYHELMSLARDINPNVKFIHHSEENARDPEAKKEERRNAAAKAFKRTFGKECEWFKEQQRDAEEGGTDEQELVEDNTEESPKEEEDIEEVRCEVEKWFGEWCCVAVAFGNGVGFCWLRP